MDTVRSVGGWLLAALSLPTAGVLYYQRDYRQAASEATTAPVAARPNLAANTAEQPSQSGLQWFDSIQPETAFDLHLRGVRAVLLGVTLGGDKKEITERDIATKVEFKLRQAGITVVKPDDPGGRRADAILFVEVSFLDIEGSSGVTVTQVKTNLLRNLVSSSGDRLTKSLASVWWNEKHGYAGQLRLTEFWQTTLDRQLEALCNAVASANGR